MVKKFLKSTTMTSRLPSTAFTVRPASLAKRKMLSDSPTNQAITQRNTRDIRLANRAVPLNPKAPPFKPRAGNFGTKRLVGF